MIDLQTAHVGQYGDGQQFFLAHHHVPGVEGGECVNYHALYHFSQSGAFTGADIRRCTDADDEQTVVSSLLDDLGEHNRCDILIAPFQVDHDGLTFGLMPDHQKGTLTLEPGSMITFMEPWDGEYYT